MGNKRAKENFRIEMENFRIEIKEKMEILQDYYIKQAIQEGSDDVAC